MKIALVTPTYAPDLAFAKLLCRSIDRYVTGIDEHLLVIDKRDKKIFQSLTNDYRKLVIKEEILPNWLIPPIIGRRWWFSLRSLPVRGWIVQQMVKLSMLEISQADIFIFADSDVVFIRKFNVQHIVKDNKIALYGGSLKPIDQKDPRHITWYRNARALFHLPQQEHVHLNKDYITQLVCWRREVLQALIDTIKNNNNQKDWRITLARCLDFSEYILYGIFVEEVLGLENSQHYATQQEIVDCSWHHDIFNKSDLEHFITNVPEQYVALLIQSNLKFSPKDYESFLQ